MVNNGWVKLHRKIIENPLYFSEPFSRQMAWIDLLLIANHSNNFFFKRGIRVDVGVGQIGYDLDSLGKRWQWSRGKVERFISMLELDGQVVRQKNNVTTLISIVNYSEYQSDSKPNSKASSKANGSKQEGKESINKLILHYVFEKLEDKYEKNVKMFHTLFDSQTKTWENAIFKTWIKEYEKLEKNLNKPGEDILKKIVAIYTELAMQKMQYYPCKDFHFKTYKSIASFNNKQKNDVYVYESILELAKINAKNNDYWINEFNKNLERFKKWN